MPSPDHDKHDRLAIAALAARDRDMDPTEAASARSLVADCTACARLLADLVALSSSLPFAATPPRTRDFTLSSADAQRLQPRGLRHWLRRIGSAGDTFTRPLALGLTTLGIAGLLVATIPGALPGSGASVLSTVGAPVGGAGAAAAPASAAPASAAPAAAASIESLQASPPAASPVDDGGVFSGGDSGDPAQSARTGDERDTAAASRAEDVPVRDDTSGFSTLLVFAGLITIVGLGLFAIRWSNRRLGDG